ncbi:uncharacterized protein EAE97_007643 [Botrytis byssoidea]|uniref:Uncharacterized protein n=1 Tax=Botrytis byssoidea TaxID=139641 RepID=A0A9P5LW40_9HELO|nr:uncharacterized protein EAE97_007643 [Botrytis byssoidea]KAF7937847.1 hypothetical protein EAE97_007643 [Botrytis byssoidea]
MSPTSMFNVIGKELLRKCDDQDDLIDTVVFDPNDCNFDADALLCGQYVTNGMVAGFRTVDYLAGYFRYTDKRFLGNELNSTSVFPH